MNTRTCGSRSALAPAAGPAPDPLAQAHQPPVGRLHQAPAQCPTLAGINRELEQLHRPVGANETALRKLLEDWRRLGDNDQKAYWLILARIAELTLLTAGAYADGCEFQAAGDLLVNPAKVRLHLRNSAHAITKPRHQSVTTLLRPLMGERADVKRWYRTNAVMEISQAALLPDLAEKMAASGRIAPGYIDSFNNRMGQVATTVAFLCAWQVADSADLCRRWEASPAETRRLIKANLCRFGDGHFRELGGLVWAALGSPEDD